LIKAEELLAALKIAFVSTVTFLVANASGVFEYHRLILTILFLSFIWITIDTLRFRNNPISVLGSKIRIHFEDADGNRVRIVREQKFRANTPNITAYFMGDSADFGGSIPRVNINQQTDSKTRNLRSDLQLFGNDKAWEVIQLFNPVLPYRWYSTLVPEWYLRLLATITDNARLRLLAAFLLS
jgi:hypothetical protein